MDSLYISIFEIGARADLIDSRSCSYPQQLASKLVKKTVDFKDTHLLFVHGDVSILWNFMDHSM